jgi:hypothetical protein
MMAIVQVQKPVKLQATELTWIGGGIGILEVLAPHLGEPRLVLVTSGLELVCVLSGRSFKQRAKQRMSTLQWPTGSPPP